MKTISADFNAMTESDRLRLNFPRSETEMCAAGVRPGDWVWLSDGEIVVGARLEVDPRYGLVGAPAWETLVHLDSAEGKDVTVIWSDIQRLVKSADRSRSDATELLQSLMQFEEVAPPDIKAVVPPDFLPLNRALALRSLDHPWLALMEIEESLRSHPDPSELILIHHIDLLRRVDLERAVREAAALAERSNASASVRAVCINVLATQFATVPDDQVAKASSQVLEWIERFEKAPGRKGVDASLLATVRFNRGVVLLRLGQLREARSSFELAHSDDPIDPAYLKAIDLDAFDEVVRDIARTVQVLS